jgi:CheY-like chemotaxis protein
MNEDQPEERQANPSSEDAAVEHMTAESSDSSIPKAAPRASSWQNKTVLLIDVNPHTRDSRAKIMRTLGVTVDCVANAETAQLRLATGKYNMVLMDLGRDLDGAELLAREIKTKNPRQLVAFLVGRPLLVSTTLNRVGITRQRPQGPVVAAQKQSAPVGATMDFGQKIRDAEAEQAAS